jgi:trehalose 6-phosphate phosphatase
MRPPPRTAPPERLLAPLRERPQRTAVLCDVDGTLAPIAARPEQAVVTGRARAALDALADRYALVACVSGRRAATAREMVGLDSLTYIGNHGLELLAPAAREPSVDSEVRGAAERVRRFADARFDGELSQLGVTLEDKDSIRSFHYREAEDLAAAHTALEEVATAALEEGLYPRWGRKVLEIRPTDDVNKGSAIAAVLAGRGLSQALYGGDDVTDLDAFRRLRALAAGGALEGAVCVGVASEEGPREIVAEADLVVDGTEGFCELLEMLADTGA